MPISPKDKIMKFADSGDFTGLFGEGAGLQKPHRNIKNAARSTSNMPITLYATYLCVNRHESNIQSTF